MSRFWKLAGNHYAGHVAAFTLIAICSASVAREGVAQSAVKHPAPPAAALAGQSLPEAGQETFPSPHAATHALIAALQKGDLASLLNVLGPSAKDIISSGDPAEDRESQQQFLQKYQQMHRLQLEPDGFTTLYIGPENWPTPIPLAHYGTYWFFDTAAGKKEVLYRRIGQNELTVIQLCGELVDAQKEYYSHPRDGDRQQQYAQKILSSPEKHNGLYWPVAAGQAESPLGALVAAAEKDGYTEDPTRKPEPFYGYYFRVLKAQGAGVPGGAMSYIVNGRMTRGFAFLAYPAKYRSSGVMTFMVGKDGVVYQKDLGPKTEEIVKSLTQYNHDATWKKAD